MGIKTGLFKKPTHPYAQYSWSVLSVTVYSVFYRDIDMARLNDASNVAKSKCLCRRMTEGSGASGPSWLSLPAPGDISLV